MKREDDQELWDLLGKAEQPPSLSPFFARNVLREIRQQPTWRERFGHWFGSRRLVPAAAVAVAVVATVVSLRHGEDIAPAAEEDSALIAQFDEVDYEVVADLDDLAPLDEDALLFESETSTL